MTLKKFLALATATALGVTAQESPLPCSSGAIGNVTTAAIATLASAQCNASTVYYPVTYTYTTSVFVDQTVCPGVAAESAQQPDPPSPTTTRTATSTFFSTTTVFATPGDSSSSVADPASTTPFMFSANSGTTSWINGNSPSSGVSLVVATTTIEVPADPPSTSHDLPSTSSDPQTTLSDTATVSPPAYASTSFSLVSPDITSTTHITRTLTVSDVSTVMRSSFSGVGSAGWNSSSTSASEASPVDLTTSSISGTPTTGTMTYYWASGNTTYSTSTNVITTTIYGTAPADTTSTITGNATTVTERLSQVPTTATVSVTVISVSASRLAVQSSVTSSMQDASINTPASKTISSDTAPNPTVNSTFGSTSKSTATAAPISTGDSSGSPVIPASATISESSTANSSSLIPASLSGTQLPAPTSDVAGVPSAYSMPTFQSSSEGSTAAPITTAANLTASISSPTSLMSSLSTTASGLASFSSSQAVSTHSSPNATTSTSSSASPSSYSYGYGAPVPISAVSSSSLSPVGSSHPISMATSASTANGTSLTLTSGSSYVSTSSITTLSSMVSSSPSSLSSLRSTTSGSTNSSLLSTMSPTFSAHSISSKTSITSRTTSMSASPTPTTCSEHGNFTLNFDDLPTFSSNTNDTDITQAAPIFNPYHHLSFSDGYVHAPPPGEPFPPHSGSQLAVFTGNASGGSNSSAPSAMSPRIGHMQPGEVGDGPYDSSSAYWLNAYGAWLGCDNSGPAPCVFNVTGYTWDAAAQQEVPAYNTEYNLPGCPSFKDCQLQHVSFPPSFVNLTGIQIQASVDGQQRMFFMDDLALGWSNNTCAAGLQRESAPGQQGGAGPGAPAKMRIVRR